MGLTWSEDKVAILIVIIGLGPVMVGEIISLVVRWIKANKIERG